MSETESEPNPDFCICEGCGGEFYHGDLVDGSLCADCYAEAFGDNT